LTNTSKTWVFKSSEIDARRHADHRQVPSESGAARTTSALRALIPKGYAFYRSIGTRSMDIELIDITGLEYDYVLSKVRWN